MGVRALQSFLKGVPKGFQGDFERVSHSDSLRFPKRFPRFPYCKTFNRISTKGSQCVPQRFSKGFERVHKRFSKGFHKGPSQGFQGFSKGLPPGFFKRFCCRLPRVSLAFPQVCFLLPFRACWRKNTDVIQISILNSGFQPKF